MDKDDADAEFAALVKTYHGPLLRVARGLLGDDGDDAVNDVWEAVLRSKRRSIPPDLWQPYLFTALRHKAAKYWRRQEDRRTVATYDEAICVIRHDSDIEECIRRMDTEILRARLVPKVLSMKEFLTVLLRAYYGYGDREIAEIAGIRNVATVRARAVAKALKELGLEPPPQATGRSGPTKG